MEKFGQMQPQTSSRRLTSAARAGASTSKPISTDASTGVSSKAASMMSITNDTLDLLLKESKPALSAMDTARKEPATSASEAPTARERGATRSPNTLRTSGRKSHKPGRLNHPSGTVVLSTSATTDSEGSEGQHHQRESWMLHKAALKSKFPEGWQPRKRLSPDSLESIRNLHKTMPTIYTTQTLANSFKISPEAVRKILKSKWTPNAEEQEQRRARWIKRGEQVWADLARQGVKPPAKWRERGIYRSMADRPGARREEAQQATGISKTLSDARLDSPDRCIPFETSDSPQLGQQLDARDDFTNIGNHMR